MHNLRLFFVHSVCPLRCSSLPHCDIRLNLLVVSNVSAPIARSDALLRARQVEIWAFWWSSCPLSHFSKVWMLVILKFLFSRSIFELVGSNQLWLRFWTWLWFDYWNQLNVINRDDLTICKKGNACLVMICSEIASRLTFWILKLFMPIE